MKQTAVEWFAKELNNWRIKEFGEYSIIGIPQEVFNQAKQMEKEQIIEAHFTSSGCNSFDMPTDRINSAYKAAEQYYNETFKSE